MSREIISHDELYRRLGAQGPFVILTTGIAEDRIVCETLMETEFPQYPHVRRMTVYLMHPMTWRRAGHAVWNYFGTDAPKWRTTLYAEANGVVRIPITTIQPLQPIAMGDENERIATVPAPLTWDIKP